MFSIVLYQPEIPPNTGNIIRLCSNIGCDLHLIKPLGFTLDNKKLRRAGLDYHEFSNITVHNSWHLFCEFMQGRRMFAVTTKGSIRYSDVKFNYDDVFIFGPETRGLPNDILLQFSAENKIVLPMLPKSRSLNLSNCAAVLVYEAWKQNGFYKAG